MSLVPPWQRGMSLETHLKRSSLSCLCDGDIEVVEGQAALFFISLRRGVNFRQAMDLLLGADIAFPLHHSSTAGWKDRRAQGDNSLIDAHER